MAIDEVSASFFDGVGRNRYGVMCAQAHEQEVQGVLLSNLQ